jgi:hypothetical protein
MKSFRIVYFQINSRILNRLHICETMMTIYRQQKPQALIAPICNAGSDGLGSESLTRTPPNLLIWF